jgi:hypothetical protein
VMEVERRRWVPRRPGNGGRAASMGPKAVALGAGVQVGVLEVRAVEADMPMWRLRQWRVGRGVLIVGQASVGGSLGSRAGAKAVAALGAGVQAEAVEGVRGDSGGGCPRWRWIWWVSEVAVDLVGVRTLGERERDGWVRASAGVKSPYFCWPIPSRRKFP